MTSSNIMTAGALAATIAITACRGDFHLSVSNLQVAPSPAVPGDVVVASAFVIVNPVEQHTIIVRIDDHEHVRQTSSESHSSPVVITLGDAADLIATYGEGLHRAIIEVRAEESNESARTQSVGFELRATP